MGFSLTPVMCACSLHLIYLLLPRLCAHCQHHAVPHSPVQKRARKGLRHQLLCHLTYRRAAERQGKVHQQKCLEYTDLLAWDVFSKSHLKSRVQAAAWGWLSWLGAQFVFRWGKMWVFLAELVYSGWGIKDTSKQDLGNPGA